MNALSAQGFDAAHGWTINFFNEAGDYRMDTYFAWTENKPTVTEGALQNLDGGPKSGYGGATIGLHYSGADGGHWIQVVRTNGPIPAGVAGYQSPSDPGFTWFVDDAPNNLATDGPFYDAHFLVTVP